MYISLLCFSYVVCVCVLVCVSLQPTAAQGQTWSALHKGLWSQRPTDHRIVALNGPQIIKQATRIDRNAEADGRSTG